MTLRERPAPSMLVPGKSTRARRVVSLALLALLLLAQLTALQHQLWHAGGLAAQGQRGAVSHASEPSRESGTLLCALHDALASVTTSLGSATPALTLAAAIASRLASVALPFVESPAPRPASRGPPLPA
jgi:hypothetical protein